METQERYVTSTDDVRFVTRSQLTLHWELNRRKDEDHVFALQHHMQQHGYDEKYPIGAILIGEDLHVFSGHHRVEAAFGKNLLFPNLPVKSIPCAVRPGNFDDLIYAMQADHDRNNPAVNSALGLPLNRKELREQRGIQLCFPVNFSDSNNVLAKRWGCSAEYVRAIREQKVERILQIRSAWDKKMMSQDELLTQFHFTPDRLDQMYHLIQSGERKVTRGNQQFTQKTTAGEEKKQSVREELIAEYRTNAETIRIKIERFVDKHRTLDVGTVRRRLFNSLGLSFAENATKWATPAIRKEIESQVICKQVLAESRTAWMMELTLIHKVRNAAEPLFMMQEKPLLTDAAKQTANAVRRIRTAEWEDKEQDERIQYLRDISRTIDSAITDEVAARDKVAIKHTLTMAIRSAQAARTRLIGAIEKSALIVPANLDKEDFAKFVHAACKAYHNVVHYDTHTDVLDIENIQTSDRANQVKTLCENMIEDIKLRPEWIQWFFPPTPLPGDAPIPVRAPKVEGGKPREQDTPFHVAENADTQVTLTLTDAKKPIQAIAQAVVTHPHTVTPASMAEAFEVCMKVYTALLNKDETLHETIKEILALSQR